MRRSSLNLSAATGQRPSTDASGTGTIIEPSAPPALSIGDVTVAEDGGTATLLVKISRAPDSSVNVNLNSVNGTATTQSTDYTALTSASVSWGSGDGSDKTVTVPINDDTIDENSETFTVSLANESPGTQVTTRTATVTITDNDNVSALAVNDVSVTEPTTGTVNAVFTVTLSPASERTVTAPYSVAAGTATPGADYTTTSGSLTFSPGQTSKTVTVVVKGDTVNEPNETFILTLGTPTGAKIGDGEGLALIVDPSAPPALTIADGTVDEGGGTLSLVGHAERQCERPDDHRRLRGCERHGDVGRRLRGHERPALVPTRHDLEDDRDPDHERCRRRSRRDVLRHDLEPGRCHDREEQIATVRLVDNDPYLGAAAAAAAVAAAAAGQCRSQHRRPPRLQHRHRH